MSTIERGVSEPHSMMVERSIWVHQANQCGESTPAEYASTLLPRGITKVYLKALDGTDWMSTFYSHPLAPSGIEQFRSLVQAFSAVGLTLVPWVVPRTGSSAESTAHLAVGRVMGGLIIDFEYHYAGFFGGSSAQASAYFAPLKSLPWFAIAPDPRQPGRDYPASLEVGATAILPQTYWTDFQLPALDVLNSALSTSGGNGASFEPILPYNASAADMQAALKWCDAHGVQGISLWRMGVANADQLDAFGTTAQPAPPSVPSLPKITLGTNVDALNNPRDPVAAKAQMFQGVRVTMCDDDRCRAYATAAKAAGLFVLGVEDQSARGYILPPDLVDAVQIGNEPDQAGPSSWTRTVDEYVQDLQIYRGTYPQYTMIAAGLASGDPSYLQQVIEAGGLDGYSAIAVHPYAKSASEASDLLDAYQALTELPIVVSEWNRPVNEISDFRAMLAQKTVQAFWFCDGDWMVDGMGLFDKSGNPKAELIALVDDPSSLQQRIADLEAQLAAVTSQRDEEAARIAKALADLQS